MDIYFNRYNLSYLYLKCLEERGITLNISEAMLFGIAGGLGIGFSIAKKDLSLDLGFYNNWSNSIEFLSKMALRTNIAMEERSTTSKHKADMWLEEELKKGPVFIWVEANQLPYMRLKQLSGREYERIILVMEAKGNNYIVNDFKKKFILTKDTIIAARAEDLKLKHRMCFPIEQLGDIDIKKIVKEGIDDCLYTMESPSKSFSIPSLKKMSKLLLDDKSELGVLNLTKKKGNIFLYETLVQAYIILQLFTDGGAFRYVYSDFLKEAAVVLNNRYLEESSRHYLKLGKLWQDFTVNLLPDYIPFMTDTRIAIDNWVRVLRKGEIKEEDQIKFNQQLMLTLSEIRKEIEELDVEHLLADLSDRADVLYEREREAIQRLKRNHKMGTR